MKVFCNRARLQSCRKCWIRNDGLYRLRKNSVCHRKTPLATEKLMFCNRARLQSCRNCNQINVGFSPCGLLLGNFARTLPFFRSLLNHGPFVPAEFTACPSRAGIRVRVRRLRPKNCRCFLGDQPRHSRSRALRRISLLIVLSAHKSFSMSTLG